LLGGKKRERALLPGEQEVDRFFHLEAHEPLQLAAGDAARIHQDPAQWLLETVGLLLRGFAEVLAGDTAALDQHLAQPVEAVGRRGEADLAGIEVDRAVHGTVHHAQAAGLPAQSKQLENVGEARFLDGSLDRH
jgi:hypothetical protein